MEINWKQLKSKGVKLLYVMVFWTWIESTDFSIQLIFKFKQYKKCDLCQFGVSWENSIMSRCVTARSDLTLTARVTLDGLIIKSEI